MSNRNPGRWTKQPPPGTGPCAAFVYIPRNLEAFIAQHRPAIEKAGARGLDAPPRAAQRIRNEKGELAWLVAGTEAPFTEAQLALVDARWWSKTTDVPMIHLYVEPEPDHEEGRPATRNRTPRPNASGGGNPPSEDGGGDPPDRRPTDVGG